MNNGAPLILEEVTASIPGVIYQFLVGPDGSWYFTFVSQGIIDLFEVTPDDACADADVMTRCIIDEDRPSHRESVIQAVSALTPWNHEHRIRTRSGALKWIRGAALPRELEDGSVIWNGMLSDITELMDLKHTIEEQNRLLEQQVQARTTQLSEALAISIESEARFRNLAESAPVLIWMSGLDKRVNYVNKQWLAFTGRSLEEEIGNGWVEGVHPEDIDPCCSTYRDSFDQRIPFSMEYRLRHNDGTYRWILDNGVPRFSNDFIFMGFIGSCIDITLIKEIQEQHREHARYLNESIEKERIRIARDLHDSIGQSLTLLSFDTIRVKQETDGYGSGLHGLLDGMLKSIQNMVTALQEICTNLRPALLDDLGLEAAVDWVGDDFTRRTGIPCTVSWDGEPCRNPHCTTDIFRVIQEALANIAKYSGATDVQIHFTGSGSNYLLEIHDNGCGFNVDSIPKGSGFGIISMRERAESLGAAFNLKSTLEKGTVITINIPCGTKESCRADTYC
ncbi:MAG: PAS domain-containing protein [Desulfuromonadales bacterium]